MSNTKALNGLPTTNNALYKLQENNTTFVSNAFPLRRFVRSNLDHEQAWIAAYKTESKKYFEAVLTNQKLDDIEREQYDREKNSVPKRRILKHVNFPENKAARSLNQLDGFYLMQLCCVDDPLDLCSVDISAKNLKNIKEEDMGLFENITDINANENNLNFEAFRSFQNLKNLLLACNNIKTIRLKHEEFNSLESLDLSYNNMNPNDISHLGVLKNLKMLKLTGNNLTYLPDTFTKLYVKSKDNKKIVSEKFPSLEELYLDHNKLKEENSFDVLAVLKKLRILFMNSNCLTCVPSLKIFRDNHVVQEFNKSYHKRKAKKYSDLKSRRTSFNSGADNNKLNETMVKDLTVERSNSEMNMHSSNILRNSFIIEEDEEAVAAADEAEVNENLEHLTDVKSSRGAESPVKKVAPNQSELAEMMEKSFDLPFSELVYINLADNQIQEEDDLISLVSWPLLNEIIIYGNPIVYNNVGHPPLLKQYLIDRLGINLQRTRPLKALKTPILLPQRDHRIIEDQVPKIPKMPVEMRMLTYYTDSDSDSRRTHLSSNSTSSNFEESFVNSNNKYNKSNSSGDSKNHVYKPFKPTQESNKQPRDSEESYDNEYDETTDYYDCQTNQTNDKNYNSFFMTQVDQEEALQTQKRVNETKPVIKKQVSTSSLTSLSSAGSSRSERFHNYELLLHIENEHEIKVPKDVSGSVRVLKQMLNNPLVFREPCRELDKKQNAYKSMTKNTPKVPVKSKHLQPKLTQVNEIVDEIRDRKHVVETSLIEALSSRDDAAHEESKRLFCEAQDKYDKIKKESLKDLHGQKKTKAQMDIIMEQIKADNQTDAD